MKKITMVTKNRIGKRVRRKVDPGRIVFPGDAVMTLHPSLPPLHSREFGEWLEKWHRTHNGAKKAR